MTKPFHKLLIANRGEIACRIIRTARRMGILTVAVFSDADRDALHVSMADEAVHIGPPPARESYLHIEKIIAAALRTGAGAIHPGYGFLSENEKFAEASEAAGIIFVGPSAEAIRAMGSKSAAKALMEKSGVPLVPGYHGADQDDAVLAAEAHRVGYPVMVKAAAGGGGKGMRIAESEDDFAGALAGARREASAAFGDDTMLIEKYIVRPRHIEVQVFGDSHGSVVSLFERECTLQRRHQKVVEEAPAAQLSEDQRERICEAARAAAASIGYRGAGTVEFVANDDGFYFIEMNTRLQVEHPVTEMITGLDLVEWQLRVAAGERLPLKQEEITRTGHAVEVRIYAEDPQSGFLPSIGRIMAWRQPPEGEGIRIDTGFREGDMVTPHYDPMLAKLIIHGADRAEALARLGTSLDHFQVAGLKTNIPFLRALARHPSVAAGKMDTGLIERELEGLLKADDEPAAGDIAAAAASVLARTPDVAAPSPWDAQDGWMIAGERRRRLLFETGDGNAEAIVVYRRGGLFLEVGADTLPLRFNRRADGKLDVFSGDIKETISTVWNGEALEFVTPRGRFGWTLVDTTRGDDLDAGAGGHLRAPMPGAIREIFASPGDIVKRGAPVLVMEAMKMEHTLRAPADGKLVALKYAVGDFVEEGADLAEIEPLETEG